MKKIIWTNGIIAGLIVSAWLAITLMLGCQEMHGSWAMVVGFAGMLIAFSFIVVGVKTYRDKYNGGVISFGTALKIGALTALIAATFYVVAWLIEYHFFVPDFMEQYTKVTIDQLKASGASAAEIQAKSVEMAEFSKMYKNPLFNAMVTYTEILPLGLLVSLIVALVLKRRQPKVAS